MATKNQIDFGFLTQALSKQKVSKPESGEQNF